MSSNSSSGKDTGAAFMGLIGGAIFIFVILYAVVLLTNRKYAGHETAAATATVTAPAVAALPAASGSAQLG